ncbi:PEP-CTERM sorting domain-containing protein [Sphingosinithalassobacter portus]|uniref:PEP-CTERM sorting domain-containing protein n=1 Tax=Stakelama portus TaxID=2676234 RepID=UPI001EFD753B|nr:PEP-CTERM sorting domain-containing protein [Sphingosinithalassobacter portus]
MPKFRVAALASLALISLPTTAFAQQRPHAAPAQPAPQTILFIGNSFTFGALSSANHYGAGGVTDLNGEGIGGVPALFKIFTEHAGLDYAVSLETAPGRSLEWHWENKRALLDRPWDHVVMQEYSTLDAADPGNPAKLVDYAGRWVALFTAKNPGVDISLTATWTRPDQTYRPGGKWYGKPVWQMALDLRHGYDLAANAYPQIARVNPVGQAFSCAIAAGFADANPYDGIDPDTVGLWAWDHYHASFAGYYLEALTVFIGVTGEDPRRFGGHEKAAMDNGLSPIAATRLQRVAWAATHGESCSALAAE